MLPLQIIGREAPLLLILNTCFRRKGCCLTPLVSQGIQVLPDHREQPIIQLAFEQAHRAMEECTEDEKGQQLLCLIPNDIVHKLPSVCRFET